MQHDIVIRNGTIVDGSGQPRFRASLGIGQGKIAEISQDNHLSGHKVIDATSLVVTPGFIDFHSHSDWVLPLDDHDRVLASLVLQGVTTIVTGQCGFSPAPVTNESEPLLNTTTTLLRAKDFPYPWRSMNEFLTTLETNGLLLNTALLVGHGTLRYIAMGEKADTDTPPSMAELDTMCHVARQAMHEGAFGLSLGLAYSPGVFANNKELLHILRVAAEEAGIVTVHGRAYSWISPFYTPVIGGIPHNMRSVQELLDLARQSGVRLQLSHQIFVGRRTWRTHRVVLREIEKAAASGVDVAFDARPFTRGVSTIKVVFPKWFLDNLSENIYSKQALRRLKAEMLPMRLLLGLGFKDITLKWGNSRQLTHLEGLNFVDIARKLGMSCSDAYIHVAQLSDCQAGIFLNTYSGDDRSEAPLQAVLSHPLCAFMTDSILTEQGQQDPASFGTFPRIIGRYSRDLGLFPLEEAIRRMTTWPASRLGLADVGRIAQGAWADLVLFDPSTISDNNAGGQPGVPPTGIHAVLISGKTVAENGLIVSTEKHGRVLRR
jgi:N-acyl-D-amino-acid deacylase